MKMHATSEVHQRPTPRASELPEGYRARAATWDDVPLALELFNTCEIDEHGEPDYDESEIRDEWEGIDLASDVVLIEDPSGALAGSLTLHKETDALIEAFGYVHPDHAGRGIGRWIVVTSEAKARERMPGDANGAIVVRNFVAGINVEANQLLLDQGYTAVRKFWRMEIELTDPPEAVQWPAGFTLRDTIPDQDEPGIFAVLDEAFGEHWGGNQRSYDEWLRGLKSGAATPRLWLQVFHEGHRVAIATGKPIDDYGWVSHLGVLKPYRRQGLGDALLKTQLGRFWELGVRRVKLGVDTENATGAVALYERAGMTASRSHVAYDKTISRTD